MQPHPFDTPPQANLRASTAGEILLWFSNTLPQKIHLKAIYFLSVFFPLPMLAFDFFLCHKTCPSSQWKTELRNTVIYAFHLIMLIMVMYHKENFQTFN